MWNGSISDAFIVETIVSEIERFGDKIVDLQLFKQSYLSIKNKFPSLNEVEIFNFIQIAIALYNYKNIEKVELVLTAPNSFKLKSRKTSIVVKEIINEAEKSIMLTGYSISEYFSQILDIIVNKSRKGVYVNLYVNDFRNKKEQLEKVELYKGRYLNIFDYNKGEDKMAALHAKVIVVDGRKTFISSSNLSYHGIEGNIEMGVVIDSLKKAQGVEDLFKQLTSQKIFNKI